MLIAALADRGAAAAEEANETGKGIILWMGSTERGNFSSLNVLPFRSLFGESVNNEVTS